MAWVGLVSEKGTNLGAQYKYATKTDPDFLGSGNLWVRRGIVAHCETFSEITTVRKRKNGFGSVPSCCYPRGCASCSVCAVGSEFLQRAELLENEFLFDPDKVMDSKHTGWENLHWERKYRNYRKVDSLEDTA